MTIAELHQTIHDGFIRVGGAPLPHATDVLRKCGRIDPAIAAPLVEPAAHPGAEHAGLIGPLSVNDLSPDLRKLVESMKAGDVSEPVRTARGYQLLKLESITPTNTMTLEQAREQISEHVFTDKRKAEFQKYLQKLRAQAIIEWKNEDVKKAFEEGMKAQGTAPAP